jgi:hypothetical protein
MHPRFAERIAANLATVARVAGQKGAARWWTERFPKMDPRDYDQVMVALKRRNGHMRPPTP